MDESFSQMLKEVRQAKGWTQEDLAGQLGVSQQSVQKWEAGASLPRLNRRDALVKALGRDLLHQPKFTRRVITEIHSDMGGGPRSPEEMDAMEQSLSRLSPRTRSSAFIAELEAALPEEYKGHLDPTPASDSGFITDYMSPSLYAEILHEGKQEMFSNTRWLRKLWTLSTVRRYRDPTPGQSARAYALIVVTDDLEQSLRRSGRLTFEAGMHGIAINYARNAEQAAKIIVDYERGTHVSFNTVAWDPDA